MRTSTNRSKKFRDGQRVANKRQSKQSNPNKEEILTNNLTYAETVEQFQKELQDIEKQLENDKKRCGYSTNFLYNLNDSLIIRIFDLVNKYMNSPYYIKSNGVAIYSNGLDKCKGMFGIGKKFANSVNRLSEAWIVSKESLTSRNVSGNKLLSIINSIISDTSKSLPNEFLLDEIENEICKGISDSNIGKTVKKRARNMAILIIFEIQLEEGKITEKYLNSWISGPIRDTIALSRLVDEIQNPIKNEDEINPIVEEICKDLSDSVIGNVIRKRSKDMAVFLLNELQYDKFLEEKKNRNLEDSNKGKDYGFVSYEIFDENQYLKPYLKERMLFSDKLKLLKEKAELARCHYTFDGYFLDEENMANFLKTTLILLKDSHFEDKRSEGLAKIIKQLFDCENYYLTGKVINLLSDAVSPYPLSLLNNSPDLVWGLERFNQLIDKINEVLPEVIKFEGIEKELIQFSSNIDEEYKDSDIWKIMKNHLSEVAEEVYESREEKRKNDFKGEIDKTEPSTDANDAR